MGKEPACRRCGRLIRSPSWEDPLEKEMATLSSILAWEIPWREESGRLQSMALQKSQTRLSNWAQKVTQLYTYRHFKKNILFHCGLSQDTEYSSLCYTVGLCCLSIYNSLYPLIPNCQFFPPPRLSPLATTSLLWCLWVFFCFVDRFIYVIFCACMLSHFSYVWLFAILCTIACQAPLSMGFSRQEYWSGLPCPSSGDLPDPGIESISPVVPTLQVDSLPLSQWEAHFRF